MQQLLEIEYQNDHLSWFNGDDPMIADKLQPQLNQQW